MPLHIHQLDTSFTKLNLNELLDTIVVGLSDVDEVKLLSLMLLSRLSTLAEGVVSARLDELVDAIESITKPIVPAKDDTEQDMKRKVSLVLTSVTRPGSPTADRSSRFFGTFTPYIWIYRTISKRPLSAALRH